MESSRVIFQLVTVNMHAPYLFFISEITSKSFKMLRHYNNPSIVHIHIYTCVYICV